MTTKGTFGEQLRGLSKDKKRLLEMLLKERASHVHEIPPCIRDESGRVVRLPVSSAQQRLWFIDQLERGGTAYLIPIAVHMQGVLDDIALRQALDALVKRHESLRTSFVEVDGEPLQEIARHGRFDLRHMDLRDLATGRDDEMLRHSQEELTTPFELRTGPLIRGRLLRIADDQHVLLITVHHIVSDGWSIGVLIREFAALYAAFSAGRSDPLTPLPIQYADYAHWQRRWLAGARTAEQLEYWKQHLQGAPELLALPAERPRPAKQSYRGASARVVVSPEPIAQLKSLCRRLNVTLAMALHAAWAIVLSKLSGQDDIVIGIPVANRPRPELEGVVGFFANTLAPRVRLDASCRVDELLLSVKDIMLNAYAHQEAPFEQVVEALQPARGLSHSPIFQVMLVMQAPAQDAVVLPQLTLRDLELPLHASKFDLTLSLREEGGGIAGSLSYAVDLFDAPTIDRWIEHFTNTVGAIATQPNVRLDALSLMTAAARRQVIDEFNATCAPYPATTIHELFEAQVVRTPDAVAVGYEDRTLTFADLNAQANRLARHLQSMGVGPDRLVGVCVERGVELLIALLGTWKAGGAYVPLDPDHPKGRLAAMIADASPQVVLTHARLRDRLPTKSAEVVLFDEHWAQIAAQSGANLDSDPQRGAASGHLAYVIYTSGSTGVPKGVMVEHRNVLSLWQGLERIYHRARRCRRVAVNASFNFDSSVKQLVQLLSGRAVFPVPQHCRLDPDALFEFLEMRRIEAIDCTPSQLRAWLDAGLTDDKRSHRPRLVLIGGEQIDTELWARIAQIDAIDFYNVYGPTESTVDTTFALVDATQPSPHIGRPMENRRVYVLDHARDPVPIGVVGEIYIGGAGVARGYLNRAELTAERFLRDPHVTDPRARMYRTGDLARWRPDGTIEYLGRNDHQIKIRGFRIELEEIEAQLARHQHVKQAVAVVRDDASGEPRLFAYVVLEQGSSAESIKGGDFLREHLEEHLPDYMLPTAIVVIDELPLTANGKIDRNALSALSTATRAGHDYEAPRGNVERTIAAVWQDVLAIDRVGRNDSFFELGGHSFLVVKALFRINQSLASALTVTDLYRNPTVRNLASRIVRGSSQEEFVDLQREASIATSLAAIPVDPAARAGAILLTGATGFVGRFLLAQLLRDTHTKIYCLVRGERDSARTRLLDALKRWDLWREEYAERVVAVAGDLRAAQLGLDVLSYETLCEQVDTIFHCATSMNHLETYAMAKSANVGAAHELLELATRRRRKIINHVSTLSVFSTLTGPRERTIDETTPIDGELHVASNGYASSKWVSEKIFLKAGERRVPCNIFRLGLVWADTAQGRYDELQREYRTLKSCLLSGFGIENYGYVSAPVPVDYVARAIVALAGRHPDGRGVFHLLSRNQPVADLFERCNRIADTSLELLSHYEWIREVKRLHEQGRSLPVVPLIEFAFAMDEAAFTTYQQRVRAERIQFGCARTHWELGRAGIAAPPFSDTLLELTVKSMLSTDAELREVFASNDFRVLRARESSFGLRQW